MVAARWRGVLDKCLNKNRSDVTSRYLQFATVGKDGFPSNRTVVFRGFCEVTSGDDAKEVGESGDEKRRDGGGDGAFFSPTSAISGDGDSALYFITDGRSEKVEEIGREGGVAEACWYLPITREQFRIRGDVHLVNAESEASGRYQLSVRREEVWQRMSESARAQFAWPAPGSARCGDEEFASSSSQIDEKVPLPNFLLMVLLPTRVDHLQLKPKPNLRTIHTFGSASQQWEEREVNP
uniref:Pyridoxamine 5'-phosphate oxidase Alr4036 family FMN-binding domain-containing protein n=1 Tax=Palpitomonas bilix TaxID=652834 RepID=A0A7S3G1B0_9EUKA|mmetsp:Transcript_17789/g.44124  ORF Transcript_17789/g.44124 Transcript_17789/m.44124 type:complete len:238 (-) Transcript_17789:86-799(-)